MTMNRDRVNSPG